MVCTILNLEWKGMLLGEGDWQFLLMVALRTIIMFLIILIGLRMLGKRGVSQLSVFELGVIVGLGSAAGDPMFYKDVGLLSCIMVFIIVVAMYHLLKYITGKYDVLDKWVEGDPVDLIRDGQLIIEHLNNEPLTREEFYSLLRVKNISHLGQVKQAILEPTGQISIFFFEDEEVRLGMPILPQLCSLTATEITQPGDYSCVFCSYTLAIKEPGRHTCPVCNHDKWVTAISDRRIR